MRPDKHFPLLRALKKTLGSLALSALLLLAAPPAASLASRLSDRLPEDLLTGFSAGLRNGDKSGAESPGATVPAEVSAALARAAESLPASPLENPLPQGYRIGTTSGAVLFIPPAALLTQLAKAETAHLSNGWEEDETVLTALAMRLIGLHTAILGRIGDRVSGCTAQELNETVWLTEEELEEIAEISLSLTSPSPAWDAASDTAAATASPVSADTDKSRSVPEALAEACAGYFLSSGERLVREASELTLSQLCAALSEGKTPGEIWNAAAGTECELEKADS